MRFELGSESVDFTTGGAYPARRPLEFAQAVDRTSAGTLKVESLGVTFKRRELNFDALPKVDYDNLETFLEDVAQGAINDFTFTDEYDNTFNVRCITSIYDLTEDRFESFSGTILLEIV